MNDITMITGNEGKYREALDRVTGLKRVDLDLDEIQSVEVEPVIAKKLQEASLQVAGSILVEDVGLFCKGLNGLPGALVKWYLERLGPQGIYEQVKATGNTEAEAVCVVGFKGEGGIKYFRGAVKGAIVSPRGEGFGWDSIFEPEGSDKTFGEMSIEEKQRYSMRAVALAELSEHVNS